MEERIETKSIKIDGKEFILLDQVDKYYFFFEESNPENICVLKEKIEDKEELLVSLDDDSEIDKAFDLIEEKYQNK